MQQGPGSQGQPSLALRYGERGAGGENGLRCSLDLRRIGAVVCCRRSVSLCRMQFPEARFGPSVQRGLGAERPSWLKGHGWGWAQKAFARTILLPHEGKPVGRGFRPPRPPAKQQGPGSRGRPGPLRPMESRGPGAKTACVAFSIRGALGLWFAARGEFPFAECSCQKIVWGRRCDGA